MNHLTTHKHREPNYLRAYKAPAYKAADIYVHIIYVLIKHHLYNCRGFFTNQLFYAKQTQFPKGQNEHKCC
jgi:hypothetical protein